MLKQKRNRIRKYFCIFFVGLGSLITGGIAIHAAINPPPSFLEQSDGGHMTSVGSHIEFFYQAVLKGYDRKSETAAYRIGQYFTVKYNYAEIMSDRVYLSNRLDNRKYIGDFTKYNGIRNPGVYQRGDWFEATLVSGDNWLIMEGQGGDAGTGDARIKIVIPRFGHDPVVHGIDGEWTQGDISKGIRTWQSLYTDGARGSSEGNKQPTRTGFFFSDEDEQPERVSAYANVPISQNAFIAEVARQENNGSWNSVNWTAMDHPGIYRIKCCTKDQAGNSACGYRNVNVKRRTFIVTFRDWDKTVLKKEVVDQDACAIAPADPQRKGYHFSGWDRSYCMVKEDTIVTAQYDPNTYTIQYLGNGATGGNTPFSTHTYDREKALNPNGYVRNNYRFLRWNRKPDDSDTAYQDKQLVKNLSAKDHDVIKLYAIWDKAPEITAQDRWFFEDEDIDDARLLEYVQAHDQEDGNLKDKVNIVANTLIPHTVGTYMITYQVKDSVNQLAQTTAVIHIVSRTPSGSERIAYLRFIDSAYLNTLKPQSIWREDAYAQLLSQTLNTPVQKEVWVLDEAAIAQIRQFNDTHDFSKESDEAFYTQFAHLRQIGGTQ